MVEMASFVVAFSSYGRNVADDRLWPEAGVTVGRRGLEEKVTTGGRLAARVTGD